MIPGSLDSHSSGKRDNKESPWAADMVMQGISHAESTVAIRTGPSLGGTISGEATGSFMAEGRSRAKVSACPASASTG